MKIVVQRVAGASVTVGDETVSSIGKGILVFVGICKGDTPEIAVKFADKISKLRIFDDIDGKMNKSICDINGEILSVSQFTLAADLSRGNRPGFDLAEAPGHAKELWETFNTRLRENGLPVMTGVFAASMEVNILNDGPVTFVL